MNYDLLFIQKYYYYLVCYILLLLVLIILEYQKKKSKTVDFLTLCFVFFSVYYIGSRDFLIGVDTIRYSKTFELYSNTQDFFVRKDFFYDYLNYILSQVTDFQGMLFVNAILYILPAWYGLRKIFKNDYILPFLVFLISPYFINNGINVMRSGIAGSIFILGIGTLYLKEKKWKWMVLFLTSLLFHISFIVPLTFFVITYYFRNTKLIFSLWLFSILMAILNINIIGNLLNVIEFIAQRGESYVQISNEENSWSSFIIFGFFPVVFGVYNIVICNYKNHFYKWLLNGYMLSHVPYIMLISTEYAARLGYLAEFMMPILLMYPLLIKPVIKIKFYKLKFGCLIFFVFMIKAYKILII